MLTSSAAMATVDRAASATTHASSFRDEIFPGSVMLASYKYRLRDGGGGFRVSDRGMTAAAVEALRSAVNDVAVDRGGDIFMAAPAGVFHNPMVELRDLDGVGIPAGGEVEG